MLDLRFSCTIIVNPYERGLNIMNKRIDKKKQKRLALNNINKILLTKKLSMNKQGITPSPSRNNELNESVKRLMEIFLENERKLRVKRAGDTLEKSQ